MNTDKSPTQSLADLKTVKNLANLSSEDRLKLQETLRQLEAREWIGFWVQYRQGNWSGLEIVERGVRTHVKFDASEFFARLLATRPRAFMLVHNHPSGVTTPSWTDYRLTARIGALARQFGIELRGHWIVGPHSEEWIAPDGSGEKPEDFRP